MSSISSKTIEQEISRELMPDPQWGYHDYGRFFGGGNLDIKLLSYGQMLHTEISSQPYSNYSVLVEALKLWILLILWSIFFYLFCNFPGKILFFSQIMAI